VIDPDGKATAPEGGGAGFTEDAGSATNGSVGVVVRGSGIVVVSMPAYPSGAADALTAKSTAIDPTAI
jgi:hypothetical protein